MAVAVAGLVVAAGFRLVGMSLRSLAEVDAERALTEAAEQIWLRLRTELDMPDSGKDGDVEWRTERDSVPVGDLELPFRRVTVTRDGRSMILYLPDREDER